MARFFPQTAQIKSAFVGLLVILSVFASVPVGLCASDFGTRIELFSRDGKCLDQIHERSSPAFDQIEQLEKHHNCELVASPDNRAIQVDNGFVATAAISVFQEFSPHFSTSPVLRTVAGSKLSHSHLTLLWCS